MVDRSVLIAKCIDLTAQGSDREGLVSFLRRAGCSKIDSIAILKDALGIGLGSAKELVHLSKTWEDRRDADDKLHEQIEKDIGEHDK